MQIAILFSLILALVSSPAQESPTLSPSPSPSAPPLRSVPLRFALPPMDGTISLGIYDHEGKLVRVLHREDTISEFTAGHDALETVWDGNGENGNPLPNGKYSARGYVVGDLKVEGIDYFFHDWVTDEKSPHIRHLWQLWMDSGELHVNADLANGKKTTFICDQSTGQMTREIPGHFGVHCDEVPALPNLVSPLDCAAGRDGTTWFIDAVGGNGRRQIKQLSKNRELLRRLEYVADDPQPEWIEASATEEKIFVLEQNNLLQRFRGLGLVRTMTDTAEGAVSDWKSQFEKKILEHQNFALEKGKLVPNATGPVLQRVKFSQTLRPDPLQHDKPVKIDLAIGIDADGSYLKTVDGLPLRTISDTPNLTRTLMAQPIENRIDIYQDDGAVVEQFRISNLAQMIAFDCGDFELK
jgi:hypothetical protein